MCDPGFRPLDQSFNQSSTRTPTYQVESGTAGQSLSRSYQPRVCGGVMSNRVQRGIQKELGHFRNSQPMHISANVSYKTNMCERVRSKASYGVNCTYAHGVEDLEEHRNIEAVDMQRFTKAGICRRFLNEGICPYGDRCIFLHVYREKARVASVIDATFMGSGFLANTHRHLEKNRPVGLGGAAFYSLSFRKTKMCNNWWMTGHCAYGDKCHFAHGISELQKYQRADYSERNGSGSCDSHSTKYRFLSRKRYSSSDLPMKPPMKRCLSNWKTSKKIIQIYADWIEEGGNEVES